MRRWQQGFAGRHQIALAALQRRQEVVLGLGHEDQAQRPAPGLVLQVAGEGLQAPILDAEGLAVPFAGAVPTLVDQDAQLAGPLDGGQVARRDMARRFGWQGAEPRLGGAGEQAANKDQGESKRHPGLLTWPGQRR